MLPPNTPTHINPTVPTISYYIVLHIRKHPSDEREREKRERVPTTLLGGRRGVVQFIELDDGWPLT